MDKDYCFLGCNCLYTKGCFYGLTVPEKGWHKSRGHKSKMTFPQEN
jgi:hypothetical protein